jgi:N-acetylneuraminic acid mutarotase
LLYVSCQQEIDPVVLPLNPAPTDTTLVDSPDSLAVISFSPDSGAIGTEVHIAGSGFDSIASGNQAFINTTAATVTSATKTLLTVQVAEGSTTGKVSVMARGKTARSLTDFTVLKDSVATDTSATNTNSWKRRADYPKTCCNTFVNAFSINNTGYIFNGFALWAYNPASNSWSEKASVPAPNGHTYGFNFVIGNKAYVGLGAGMPGEELTGEYSSGKNYNDVWAYDAVQNTWTQKADFPGLPRVMPFSFSVNGFGYVVGGDPTNSNGGHALDFWKYDPATDKWTRQADFPSEISIGFSGFSLAGAGYVLEAGTGNPTAPTAAAYSEKLWKYNVSANTWEQKASLPFSKFLSGMAFTIGGKAYAALGTSAGWNEPPLVEKQDFWMYDPVTNTWTRKADVGGDCAGWAMALPLANGAMLA